MNIKDIIKKLDFEDFWKAFQKMYPNEMKNMEGYETVFNNLKNRKRLAKTKYTLWMEQEKFEGKVYHTPYFKDRTKQKNGKMEHWATDFTLWSEYLAVPISRDVLRKYSEMNLLCHVIYDLTFHGFSERKVEMGLKESQRRTENFKSSIEV